MKVGAELRRILDLPEYVQGDHPPLPDHLAHWEEHLWPVQVEALANLARQPAPLGIYGDIGVGGGKFLIASLAGAAVGAKRPVVMTQPDLLRQAQTELDRFRELFPELDDLPPHYVAYSTLSQPRNTDLLHELQPDLIALDEAHAVASRESARGLRLRDYVVANPDTRVVVLSGTLNRRTLLDVYDLAELALRDQMWLPVSLQIQKVWASLLDHGAEPSEKMLRQYLDPLLRWSEERGLEVPKAITQELFQEAYSYRYLSTPGVVAPPETRVDADLHLRIWRPDPGKKIRDVVKAFDDTWELPDGTELVDALEYHRHAATLSLGFYYKPVYDADDATVEDWMDARLEWNRAIRRQIKYIKHPGVDSPANVVQAVHTGVAHPDVRDAYWAWVKIRDAVEPSNETVWFDTSMVDRIADRARSMGRGIIWVESRAMMEALADRGFPVFGAGSSAPLPSVDLPVLSRRVHGTGKNLQMWDRQIVVEPPSSATPWEQMLGRTHRPGQLSDRVECDIVAPTWSPRTRIYSAIAEADFIARTSRKKHKITFCTWETCAD